MNTSSTDSTLLDQLKTFQSESFEWEKAAEYLSESLQQIAQSEVSRIAQSLDEDGKINTIKSFATNDASNVYSCEAAFVKAVHVF